MANWYQRNTDTAHNLAAMNYEFAVEQFERDNGYGINTTEEKFVYVIGSGLADLHLNTWLAEARARTPQPSSRPCSAILLSTP